MQYRMEEERRKNSYEGKRLFSLLFQKTKDYSEFDLERQRIFDQMIVLREKIDFYEDEITKSKLDVIAAKTACIIQLKEN